MHHTNFLFKVHHILCCCQNIIRSLLRPSFSFTATLFSISHREDVKTIYKPLILQQFFFFISPKYFIFYRELSKKISFRSRHFSWKHPARTNLKNKKNFSVEKKQRAIVE